MKDRPISADFSRDRIAILAGLACVVAAGWIYLLRGAGMEMGQMGMGPGMPDMPVIFMQLPVHQFRVAELGEVFGFRVSDFGF